MKKALILLLISLVYSPSQGALRIVTYNTLLTDGNPSIHHKTVLEAIGNETVNGIARPIDVLILQEQTANKASEITLVGYLDQIYGEGVYAYVTDAVTNQADQHYVGLIYNTQTVTVTQVLYSKFSGSSRFSGRYRIHPLGPGGQDIYPEQADIYVYNTHYKAGTSSSDLIRRANEAIHNRWNANFGSDFLPEYANIIYAGDFNQKSSREDASMGTWDFTTVYGGRTSVDNPYHYFVWGSAPWGSTGYGQAVDPINKEGNWNDSPVFLDIHTQCPGTVGSGGGMDDRFDLQMISTEMNDGEGVSYIGPNAGNCTASVESYRAFGNNGTHRLNGLITTGSALTPAVLSAIANASDHLPVVADYQLPAVMDVNVLIPETVIAGSTNQILTVTVGNIAQAQAAAGADELDFQIDVYDGLELMDTYTGTDQPLGGGTELSWALDASTIGPREIRLVVTSSSPAAANAFFDEVYVYHVTKPDLNAFTAAWLATPQDDGWNPDYNFIPDDIIDLLDFSVFASHW